MQIETSQTYSLLMSAQGANLASNNASEKKEQPQSPDAVTTAKTAEKTNNATTGSMMSTLSSETNRTLIDQQDTSGNAHTLTNDDTKIESPYMWEIANNPDYAAEQGHIIGNSYDLTFYPTEYFESFTKAGKTPPGSYAVNDPANPAVQVQKKRSELYDSLVDQGLPPVEIIKEIYRFNASLPKSYTDRLDPAEYYPDGHYHIEQENNLNLLEQYQKDAELLHPGVAENLQQIASDSDFAASKLKEMGSGARGNIISSDVLPFPTNDASLAEKEAFLGKMDHINAIRDSAAEVFSAFYENSLKDGQPSAQAYAKLLEFQASQSEFNNLSDRMMGRQEGYTTNRLKAEYTYLQQAIKQNAPNTNNALTEEQAVGESTHTPVKEEISRDTSWFESLNFVSESDRKLLSAMTGYNVDSIGRFTDKNGEPAYPEDLTQHSLRTFQMELLSARRGDSPDSIAGENITEAEFIRLINKSRAVASSMGEVFNEELLEKGLAYLARSNA